MSQNLEKSVLGGVQKKSNQQSNHRRQLPVMAGSTMVVLHLLY
jgi:hypothetical protein